MDEVRPQARSRAVQDPPVAPGSPRGGSGANALNRGAEEGMAPLSGEDELLVLPGPGVGAPRRLGGGCELVLEPDDERRLGRDP